MCAFCIGDAVRVLNNKFEDFCLHDVGTIGVVVDIDCDGSVGVEADGDTFWYLESQLEKGRMQWVKDEGVERIKEFTITFMATGGIDIEAKDENEAIAKFNAMLDKENFFTEILVANGIDVTGVEKIHPEEAL